MIEILYSQRQRKDNYKYWVQGVIHEEGFDALPFQASVDTANGILYFAFSSDCSDSHVACLRRHYGDIVEATQILTASELKPRLDAVKQKAAEIQPTTFTGAVDRAYKDFASTHDPTPWIIDGNSFILVKNMGVWSPGRSVTLEQDQCGFVIAEYNASGYVGLFRPLTLVSVPDDVGQPKEFCCRHSIKPLRPIGRLRVINNGHSLDFIREFLMMPAHEPNRVDDIWIAAQECDPTTPLGRYRYLKVAA